MVNWITATEAAKELGITRPTLMKKVKKNEIKVIGYVGEKNIAIFDTEYIRLLAEERKQAVA